MPDRHVATVVDRVLRRPAALATGLLLLAAPACLPVDAPLPPDGPWIVLHRNHLVTASIDTSRIATGSRPLVHLRFDYADPDTVGDPPEIFHRADFDLHVDCRRRGMRMIAVETFDSAGASFGVERMDSFRDWMPFAGHPFEPIADPLCDLLRARRVPGE